MTADHLSKYWASLSLCLCPHNWVEMECSPIKWEVNSLALQVLSPKALPGAYSLILGSCRRITGGAAPKVLRRPGVAPPARWVKRSQSSGALEGTPRPAVPPPLKLGMLGFHRNETKPDPRNDVDLAPVIWKSGKLWIFLMDADVL